MDIRQIYNILTDIQLKYYHNKFMKQFFYIVLLLSAISINANNPYVRNMEPAVLEVIYERMQVTDTTSRDKQFVKDDVLLRIGNNMSLFCGVKKLWEDSISKVDYASYSNILKASYQKDPNNFSFLGGRYWSYIYKDRQSDELTECDYFNMTHWKYREPLQIPEWTVTDSIKNCIGYDCIKATASFKGRTWTAWFAPEIPVSDGPWKLCGLPGLILKAYDANHDYEFIAKAIYTSGIGPVGYMEYIPENKYRTVSREQFLKEWRKSQSRNNVSGIKAAYDIKSSSAKPNRGLLYDREEIVHSSE